MDLLLGGPRPSSPPRDRSSKRRTWTKTVLVLSAALAALFLTVRRNNGIHVEADGTSRAAPEPSGDYDLAALRVYSQALVRAKDQYADPTRIDPRAMLLASLDYVQRFTPEVMVDEQEPDRILVRVDAAEKAFSIGDVDSPWMLSSRLKQIFRFVQTHVHPGQDIRDIEYAATNGMLSTLDTHSLLLSPEAYKEMQLSTSGEFGGLGIIIGIRKNKLTVLRPIPETPASRAGLKKRDHIAKINQESTINMTLTEAVGRLRGKPGSKVTVWISRRGTKSLRKFVLTRAIISIQSVHAQMLEGNVGYLRVTGFSNNTDEQLATEMGNLARSGAESYLLDLRGNPGGLLEQAVKVADMFVDGGTIVSTVGMGGKQRDEQRAHADDETRVPMAVLADFRSASAAEIVAGALRGLDRAVLLGQTTFGKGSVQVLHPNDDGSALKLTVAQYLTPGDVSIQAVGITPDLELVPVRIEEGRPVRLFGKRHIRRERDFELRPLRQEGIRAADKPGDQIRYLADPRPRGDEDGEDEDADLEDDDEGPDPSLDDEFVEDAEIRLARDLLAQASGWRRSDVLAGAKRFLAQRKREEAERVRKALGKLGVDWSPGDSEGHLDIRASLDGKGNKLTAGDERTLTVTIKNAGSATASRLHAITRCDNRLFDGLEFPIGRLEPGKSRSWSVDVKVPLRALSRTDVVYFDLATGPDDRRPATQMRADIEGLPRPLLAYGYQVIDGEVSEKRKKGAADGDGLIQHGERVRLRVDVQNTGVGPGLDTWATIKNLSGDGIFIHKGRFGLGRMEPGHTGTADFEIEVQPHYRESAFRLELAVYDKELGDFVSEKLDFHVSSPRPVSSASSAFVRTVARADVRGGADARAPKIGVLPADAVVPVTGRAGDWVRVDLGGRPGFLLAADVEGKEEGPGNAKFEPHLQVTPPILQLAVEERSTKRESLLLRGTATDDRRVADVFALVRNEDAKVIDKKVFYRSNRKGADPRKARFEVKIPLWPGQNYVTVIARENDEVRSSETLILTREGVATTAQADDRPEADRIR